jgi:hypothetical protein
MEAMIKSVKGQCILSAVTAVLFVIGSFSYIEFTGKENFHYTRLIFYFVMVVSVYNAGMLTQKYIETKKYNTGSQRQVRDEHENY